MNELEKIKADYEQLGKRIAELEAQKLKEKGYTWEECFVRKGFYVNNDSLVVKEDMEGYPSSESHKNIATTQKVCLSHLAACQLSHIIERLNKDFGGDEDFIVVCNYNGVEAVFLYSDNKTWALPKITSISVFRKLIETNTPLLNQYFGIDEER